MEEKKYRVSKKAAKKAMKNKVKKKTKEVKSEKRIREEKPKPMSELEKLEAELSAIESRLTSLK